MQSNFLKLTYLDTTQTYINYKYIISFEKVAGEEFTQVLIETLADVIHVKETPEYIINAINQTVS